MTDLPGLLLLGLRFSLALCLYAFLFWALRILWKSLQTSKTTEAKTLPPLTLRITADEDLSTHTLISAENLIGRAGECAIQLTNTTVSNLHARIYFTQAHWWIEDLNSSNGTFLNGAQINQPAVLADQDYLSLGSLTGIIEIPFQSTDQT